MGLVGQWLEIEQRLPEAWGEARLALEVADEKQAGRAAALLGPANAARRGTRIRFSAARHGIGPAPSLIRRLLARLDAEGIEGRLELVRVTEAPAALPAPPRPKLAESWDAALAALPSDWTDLYAEVELSSSDHLDRGALLLAPANPARNEGALAFRFRCARRYGYGVWPGMARRCLERLDSEDIRGAVRILYALSDVRPVATQGPVVYLGGRPV